MGEACGMHVVRRIDLVIDDYGIEPMRPAQPRPIAIYQQLA